MRAPALLCRTVGSSKARVRACDSGPNSSAPASRATIAAATPAPTRRTGSTMCQQRSMAARRPAPTRSATGVGCQATSEGWPSSQASTSASPEGGIESVWPSSTMWSSTSPARVIQTRPCSTSRVPPPEPRGITQPLRRVCRRPLRGAGRCSVSCVFIIYLLQHPSRYDGPSTQVNPMKPSCSIDALSA